VIGVTVTVAASVAGILLLLAGFAELAAYEALLVVVALGGLIALRTPILTAARPLRRSRTHRSPPQLLRIERIVRFGVSTEMDADRRLYPLLREQARELLLGRHGIDLDTEPEEARRMLGIDTWEKIRRDRSGSTARTAPGPELEEVEDVVRSIEHLLDR
jgi:hypothetical protein